MQDMELSKQIKNLKLQVKIMQQNTYSFVRKRDKELKVEEILQIHCENQQQSRNKTSENGMHQESNKNSQSI